MTNKKKTDRQFLRANGSTLSQIRALRILDASGNLMPRRMITTRKGRLIARLLGLRHRVDRQIARRDRLNARRRALGLAPVLVDF